MAKYDTDRGYVKKVVVPLPPDLLKYVLAKVSTSGYSSPGEYIKTLVHRERVREMHFKAMLLRSREADDNVVDK